MGGKAPPPPQQFSPREEAEAQILADNSAADRQERLAQQERDRKAEEDAQKRLAGNSKINTLYSGGQAYGTSKAKKLGYADTYGLLDSFNQMLSGARNNADPLDTNFNDDFNYDDMWNKSVNDAQGAEQSRLDNQFRGKTKAGWENSYFADTADDSILDAILDQQYDDAFGKIDGARQRGQLSQGAFDHTLSELNNKKLGARSTLEDMGLGVLGNYRKELGDIGKGFGDQITNYKLGSSVNLGDFDAQVNTRADALRKRLSGDIYKTVGDTALFNTDTLMARGGSMTPAGNSPLKAAFLTPDPSKEPERTTGTAGVF